MSLLPTKSELAGIYNDYLFSSEQKSTTRILSAIGEQLKVDAAKGRLKSLFILSPLGEDTLYTIDNNPFGLQPNEYTAILVAGPQAGSRLMQIKLTLEDKYDIVNLRFVFHGTDQYPAFEIENSL